MPEEANIKQLIASITAAIDDDLDDFEPIKTFARKFDLQPAYIVLPLMVVIVIFSLFTWGFVHYLITLFAILYPSYMSFRVPLDRCVGNIQKWRITLQKMADLLDSVWVPDSIWWDFGHCAFLSTCLLYIQIAIIGVAVLSKNRRSQHHLPESYDPTAEGSQAIHEKNAWKLIQILEIFIIF